MAAVLIGIAGPIAVKSMFADNSRAAISMR